MSGPFDSVPPALRGDIGPAQPIDTKAFASTLLTMGAFDPASSVMTLEFHDGDTFAYRDVPQGVWEGLKASGSPGSYFHRQIRHRYGGTPV